MSQSQIYGIASLQTSTETPSIEKLVSEYAAYISRLARSILDDGNPQLEAEVDDAVQETFLAANRTMEGFRGEASVKTWLTSIAVNICRGKLRKRKLQHGLLKQLQGILLLNKAASPEEAAIQKEGDQRLWAAVDALGEKHRLPVILHYVHELGIPEIAEILRTNQGTVYSRLHYARQKLATVLAYAYGKEVAHETQN
ncbi:MAG: RNA polymerase sigma factor [Chloroflexota bacterium]